MKPPHKIVIELLSVGNKRVLQTATFALPKGECMTGAGVDRILARFSDDVVARFPHSRYRIVPLRGHRYRFESQPKTLEELAAEMPVDSDNKET